MKPKEISDRTSPTPYECNKANELIEKRPDPPVPCGAPRGFEGGREGTDDASKNTHLGKISISFGATPPGQGQD